MIDVLFVVSAWVVGMAIALYVSLYVYPPTPIKLLTHEEYEELTAIPIESGTSEWDKNFVDNLDKKSLTSTYK